MDKERNGTALSQQAENYCFRNYALEAYCYSIRCLLANTYAVHFNVSMQDPCSCGANYFDVDYSILEATCVYYS